jgi:hypothetical protein
MKKYIEIICATLLAVPLLTFAQSNNLIKQLNSVKVPTEKSNDFEKWTYNTSLLTGNFCWNKKYANQPRPDILKNNFSSAGSWILPTEAESEDLCNSIETSGIKPICTTSLVWAKGGVEDFRFPANYLKISKKNPEIIVEGTLYCYLNEKQIQKQAYTTKFLTKWIEEPVLKLMKTSKGDFKILSGTLMVIAPNAKNQMGIPYQEPRIILVFN